MLESKAVNPQDPWCADGRTAEPTNGSEWSSDLESVPSPGAVSTRQNLEVLPLDEFEIRRKQFFGLP